MKRKELKEYFNLFYNNTYSATLSYCLKKTGDFLNLEDLVASSYYQLYKLIKKSKTIDQPTANKLLKKAVDGTLDRYWKKHKKDLTFKKKQNPQHTLEEYLAAEIDVTEEEATQMMLCQDVLEYVSDQPMMFRRAFVLYFYYEMNLDAIAVELNLPQEDVLYCLVTILKRIKKNILDEYA